uniref:Uncharacterized protein n=1 Tax=Glossina pallidipes TaxID=7398 RepID=A0A1A9Z6B6_GLOPL
MNNNFEIVFFNRESLFATSTFLCQKSKTSILNGSGSGSDGRSERGTIEITNKIKMNTEEV